MEIKFLKRKRNYIRKLVAVIIFAGGFWGVFNGILVRPITNVCFILLIIIFLNYRMKCGFKPRCWQDKFIMLFLLCLFTNFIACWANRGQNIIYSLLPGEIKNIFLLLLFYYLSGIKCRSIDAEKVLKILFFTFIACFFVQYVFFYPYPFFQILGVNEEFVSEGAGEHRFRMVSQLIGFIGYFFFLNRILTDRHVPRIYYLGCLLGLLFIILLGFRSVVVAVIISSLYMIVRVKGLRIKFIGSLIRMFLLFILVIQIPIVREQIDNMTKRQTEGQSFDNEDYVRIQQLNYFLYDHAISPSDFFWGSGIPSPKSSYGDKWTKESTEMGSHGQLMTIGKYGWVDWGVVGLSWMIGIPLGILLYAFMIYMVIKNYGKRNLYISSLYLFLIITSITTIEFYRQGAYVYHAFLLYITTLLERESFINTKIKVTNNGTNI